MDPTVCPTTTTTTTTTTWTTDKMFYSKTWVQNTALTLNYRSRMHVYIWIQCWAVGSYWLTQSFVLIVVNSVNQFSFNWARYKHWFIEWRSFDLFWMVVSNILILMKGLKWIFGSIASDWSEIWYWEVLYIWTAFVHLTEFVRSGTERFFTSGQLLCTWPSLFKATTTKQNFA